MASRTDIDNDLHREIGAFGADPLGYVRFAFPWGMPGTPLAAESGPEDWQCELLAVSRSTLYYRPQEPGAQELTGRFGTIHLRKHLIHNSVGDTCAVMPTFRCNGIKFVEKNYTGFRW